MKRSIAYLVPALVATLAMFGCGDQGDGKQAEHSTQTGGDASAEVCTAVDALEKSLDALEDSDSLEEYKERYEVVRQDFQKLREAGAGEYDTELDSFEKEMTEFGESLTSLDDGGLISGLLAVAEEAAGVAAAGDRLDEAIDCPTT